MSACAPNRLLDGPSRQRRVCASLAAGLVIQISVGNTMAATPPSTSERLQSHCTGRFDYALPAALLSSGSKLSMYRLEVASEPWRTGIEPGDLWKRQLAAALTAKGVSATAAARTREFDLAGVGPAAWMGLFADRPDLVTLLTMKPVALSKESIFLRAEASAGREGVTETVAAPDDGQSTDGDPPPGGKKLLKQRRTVGGFDGIEERVQVPDDAAGTLLVYTWIFAGRAADGAAPRIRLSASGATTHATALDAAWTSLLTSWRQRPVGMR